MITLRRNNERRRIQHGRQDTWLTFFPQNLPAPLAEGFGFLAIFNEMRLPPDASTVSNPRDEAEIITYVYGGALAQEDSTGSSCVIQAGEFQYMTTNRSIRRKERNLSRTDYTHIFRIALRPSEAGLDCAPEQKRFTAAQRRNVLCAVASRDGRKESLRIHQDALVYSSILDTGHHLFHELLPGRSAWLHIVNGVAAMNGTLLMQGDGVGVTLEPSVSLTVREKTEILMVDLSPAVNPLETGAVP